MRFLVVESDPGESSSYIAALRDAGHAVVTCHEPGAAPVPCSGLGGTCPLDGHIDATLLVRSFERIDATVREDGARCSSRDRVPLVVASPQGSGPYSRLADVTVLSDDIDHAIAALETAGGAATVAHGRVARLALQAALSDAGYQDDVVTSSATKVERGERGLRVACTVANAVDPAAYAAVGDKVRFALRVFDRHAPSIDVVVHPAG